MLQQDNTNLFEPSHRQFVQQKATWCYTAVSYHRSHLKVNEILIMFRNVAVCL
jgi:hypothetical protein